MIILKLTNAKVTEPVSGGVIIKTRSQLQSPNPLAKPMENHISSFTYQGVAQNVKFKRGMGDHTQIETLKFERSQSDTQEKIIGRKGVGNSFHFFLSDVTEEFHN